MNMEPITDSSLASSLAIDTSGGAPIDINFDELGSSLDVSSAIRFNSAHIDHDIESLDVYNEFDHATPVSISRSTRSRE